MSWLTHPRETDIHASGERHDPSIARVGREFHLRSELWLAHPIERVFDFFAEAANLEAITPAFLGFRILTEPPITMQQGLLIDYRIRLRGFPMKWRTLIRAWEPPHRFVDEQVRGPYRQWIHEHTFAEQDGGTIVHDLVRYRVRGGNVINRLLVSPDLLRIFRYRQRRIAELLSR